jgi:hypothetical protein
VDRQELSKIVLAPSISLLAILTLAGLQCLLGSLTLSIDKPKHYKGKDLALQVNFFSAYTPLFHTTTETVPPHSWQN